MDAVYILQWQNLQVIAKEWDIVQLHDGNPSKDKDFNVALSHLTSAGLFPAFQRHIIDQTLLLFKETTNRWRN